MCFPRMFNVFFNKIQSEKKKQARPLLFLLVFCLLIRKMATVKCKQEIKFAELYRNIFKQI